MRLPVLRASSTTRWLNCTWFSAHEFADGPSSEAAERGIRVHNGIAKGLGAKPDGDLPSDTEEEVLVKLGLEYATSLRTGLDARWVEFVEVEMRWKPTEDDEFKGTMDFALLSPDGKYLVVIDWKTGQRHAGYEDQLLTYAMLAKRCIAPHAETIDMRLVYLASGEEDRMIIGLDKLAQHEQRVMAAISNRSELPAEATPGAWCQWCPGSYSCPKNAALTKALEDTSILKADIRKLCVSVDTEEEAMVAHALMAYAEEVAEQVKEKLRHYVRNYGPIKTVGGQTYKPSSYERYNVKLDAAATEAVTQAGAGDAIKHTVSWTDIKKKLSKNAVALETLEADLRRTGALTSTTVEQWKTT